VREKRGRLGGVVSELADLVGGTLRRRQQVREPRVVVYDAAGHARVLPPGTPARAAVLEGAARMIELVDEERGAAAPPESE
jgi:hypothetical protein